MTVQRVEVFGDEETMWLAAALCNDADVDEDGDPVGDPTEVALLRAAGEHGPPLAPIAVVQAAQWLRREPVS